MSDVDWGFNVVYDAERKAITFIKSPTKENRIEDLLDYVREEYPTKSWLELVTMVLPQIKFVKNPEELKFYSV